MSAARDSMFSGDHRDKWPPVCEMDVLLTCRLSEYFTMIPDVSDVDRAAVWPQGGAKVIFCGAFRYINKIKTYNT